MEKFLFTRSTFKIEFLSPFVPNPFIGSTLRGGFGRAFRKSVCITGLRDCDRCILRYNCIYSYIFETPSEDKSFSNAPHPFVFNVPLNMKSHYNVGDTLNFEVILIGKGIDYLPYFIYAFETFGRMGIGRERSRFYVKRVYKGRRVIYDGERLSSGWNKPIQLRVKNIKEKKLKMTFLSPTKIISKGKILKIPEFANIINALERRISLLKEFHNNQQDFKEKSLTDSANNIIIIQDNLKEYPFKRYSSRQKRKIVMYGFVGSIVYKGNFTPFMKILRLGEIIHIGKATSFGFGRYKIEGG